MYRIGGTDLKAEGLHVIADECIRSNVELVGPLVERLLTRLPAELAAGDEADVDLALREAIVNAVVHGNNRDPAKSVRVLLARRDTGEFFAIVRDEGEGFDPARLATPLQGNRLYAPDGRGLLLMRSLVKDVTFGDDGREVRLRIA